jgi:hypothetical protein
LPTTRTAFDAVEMLEEVEMPEGAAELAVGDGFETDVLLPLDDLGDLAILDLLQRGGAECALFPLLPGVLQRRGAKKAAHHVGAIGRDIAVHHFSSPDICRESDAP